MAEAGDTSAASRIRFHLDENMWPQIADALRQRDIDVTTTNQVGLRTQPDESQIEFARSQGRVLVSKDADFLRYAATVFDHPGIVSCRRKGLTIGEAIEGLLLIYEILMPDEMTGRVEYL